MLDDSNPQATMLMMSGDIAQGDTLRFQTLLAKLPSNKPKLLFIQSPGGSVGESILLGLAIDNANVVTAVNDYCASAVHLAWLGGVGRMAGTHARIGFHAPYTQNGAVQSVSSTGAAEVGYYAAVLGLSPEAAAHVTVASQAGPGETLRRALQSQAFHHLV